jgi:hypothetical protein
MDDAVESPRAPSSWARCMLWIVNYAGVLAAPRVAKRSRIVPPRELVLETLDRFMSLLELEASVTFGDGRKAQEVAPHARRLRALCAAWTPSPDVPAGIREVARNLLSAFGFFEPPEGWDNFQGEPEALPESESPDPRPPATEAELAARPHPFLFGVAIAWCQYLASPRMIAKIPPADLRRPALNHIDSLLSVFQCARSSRASARIFEIMLIQRLATLRALCEAWDGIEAPSARVQEAARAVHMQLQQKSSLDEYDVFEEDVDPLYLNPPAMKWS